jgi:hypothetical protein
MFCQGTILSERIIAIALAEARVLSAIADYRVSRASTGRINHLPRYPLGLIGN